MEDSIIIRTLEQWLHYVYAERFKLLKKNTVENQTLYLIKLRTFRTVAKGLMDALTTQIEEAIQKAEHNIA
jgi:hypothetical protein